MPAYCEAIRLALLASADRWLHSGDNLFELCISTPFGAVEILAELTLDPLAHSIAFWDMSVYPSAGAVIPKGTILRVLLELLQDARSVAAAKGYTDVTICGYRVAGSSSARPGHAISISWNKRGRI